MKMVTTGLVIVIIGAITMIIGALIYENKTRSSFDKSLRELRDMVIPQSKSEPKEPSKEIRNDFLIVSHGQISKDWGSVYQNCLLIADYQSDKNPAISFKWNKIAGGRCVVNLPTVPHCIVTELQEGTYIFEVTVTCERYSLRQTIFVNVPKLTFND